MRKPLKINRSAKKTIKGKSSGASSRTGSKVMARVAKKSGVTGYAGSAGFQQGKEEKKRGDENRRRRDIPWDFFINVKKGESEKESILLDEEAYFMYEHSLQDSAGNWTTERCIRDQGHCPLCMKLGKEGTYVLKLTCIDLTPFKKRDGTEVKASKRIMTVKNQQMPKFQRIYDKNGGSFRGIKLNHIRDSDKDARIGNEIEQIAVLSEQKLLKYGKDLITPLKFNEVYPLISEKDLANKWGTARAMGSGDLDDEDDDDDSGGWD